MNYIMMPLYKHEFSLLYLFNHLVVYISFIYSTCIYLTSHCLTTRYGKELYSDTLGLTDDDTVGRNEFARRNYEYVTLLFKALTIDYMVLWYILFIVLSIANPTSCLFQCLFQGLICLPFTYLQPNALMRHIPSIIIPSFWGAKTCLFISVPGNAVAGTFIDVGYVV